MWGQVVHLPRDHGAEVGVEGAVGGHRVGHGGLGRHVVPRRGGHDTLPLVGHRLPGAYASFGREGRREDAGLGVMHVCDKQHRQINKSQASCVVLSEPHIPVL